MFLKRFGAALGAVLVVIALVIEILVPERQVAFWTIGLFGALLLIGGLVLNRSAVRATLGGKKARAAGGSLGYTLTVLVVLALVNFLAIRHHKRFDLTEGGQFSLSEQTIKVLESLPREVSVTAFYPDAEPTKQKFDDLMEEYKYHSHKLTVRNIDPFTHPGDAKRY